MKNFTNTKIILIIWLAFTLIFYPYLVRESRLGLDRVMFLQAINLVVGYGFFSFTLFLFTRDLIKEKAKISSLKTKCLLIAAIASGIFPLISFVKMVAYFFDGKIAFCGIFENDSSLLFKGFCAYYTSTIPNLLISMVLIYISVCIIWRIKT